MASEPLDIVAHLAGALAAGCVIGLERTSHGRPAGFRTHALVCLASSLLMLVTLYQWEWLPGVRLETVRTDPTRMAQGIMTGIGFLGAGVIFRDGLSVRGLTTAASIWITAAIGILFGVGFYFPAVLATLLTLGVLSVFRRIEARLPSQAYADHSVRFDRKNVVPEEEVRARLAAHGFSVSSVTYSASGSGTFEYRMTIRTSDVRNQARLAQALSADEAVLEFRISPMGD